MKINGKCDPAFQPVRRELRRQIRQFGGGAAVCVYLDGVPVVDCWAGIRDHQGRPWEQDTVSMSFSTTKGVTVTALHILASRGRLDYDQTVAYYWPEFAAHNKAEITVRQLLTHQAGLYNVRDNVRDFATVLDWDEITHRLANAVAFRPGGGSGYHALTIGWLAGELVQRISGIPFAEFIQKEIAKPLELDGLYIGLPQNQLPRAARLMVPERPANPSSGRRRRWKNPLVESARSWLNRRLDHQLSAFFVRGVGRMFVDDAYLQVPIPAANGHFTARSLARMYASLANPDGLNGVRLINPETRSSALTVQVRTRDKILFVPMRWRLGYHQAGGSGPNRRRNAFGHYGYGGSGAWADPDLNLAVAMTHNADPGSISAQLRMLALNNALLDGMRTQGRL